MLNRNVKKKKQIGSCNKKEKKKNVNFIKAECSVFNRKVFFVLQKNKRKKIQLYVQKINSLRFCVNLVFHLKNFIQL